MGDAFMSLKNSKVMALQSWTCINHVWDMRALGSGSSKRNVNGNIVCCISLKNLKDKNLKRLKNATIV